LRAKTKLVFKRDEKHAKVWRQGEPLFEKHGHRWALTSFALMFGEKLTRYEPMITVRVCETALNNGLFWHNHPE
jgi:hypothetical protein